MEALDTARAFEAAWQAREFEKARGFLADDLVFDSPFGCEPTPEGVIRQYAGFAQMVTGPAREIAAFGDDENALIMSEAPTSALGAVVSVAHYVVRGGRIVAETLVYDATAVRSQAPA
jgi:hypothetical protein